MLPRPEYKNVHRVPIGNSWFEVYKVAPDGTPRMVISNKSLFPGIVIKRQEHLHPDRQSAGMLFFNDEGTENGGLISAE